MNFKAARSEVCSWTTWWGYIKYTKSGLTEILWKKGVWFSENDLLHVVLIIWALYVLFIMPEHIRDLEHFIL